MNSLVPPSSVSGTSAAPAQHLVTDRLSDRLAALLAGQIERGELNTGDRLPTEPQLAGTHGVSRTVVREAVHQLRSLGLVVSRQGSGVFVAPPALHQPLAFDPSVLESLASVVQIVEVRGAIEGEIAALAAKRATRADISTLRRSLADIDAAVNAGGDGVAEDLAFHRAIAQATGNPHFRLMLEYLEQYLREAMRVTRGNEARHREFMQAVRAEHHALVDAIAAHDAAAARRAAAEHMQRAAQRLEEGGVIATSATHARRSAPNPLPRRRKG